MCIGDSIKVTCKYQEELPPSKACDSSPSLIVNTAYLNFSWDICSDNVCSYQFNVSESRLQEFICEERYTIETDVCFTNNNTRSELSETKSIRPLGKYTVQHAQICSMIVLCVSFLQFFHSPTP